jgi:hypothetical protein
VRLRLKVALAGIAGVGVAWLLPHAARTPAPPPTATPSNGTGVTAVEFPLASVAPGVSFRSIDGVRVFLVRSGDAVRGFVGVSTETARPVWWCPKNHWFEDEGQHVFYGRGGEIVRYSSRRGLDEVRVLVSNSRVTVFPHSVEPGSAATFPANYAPPLPAPPPPCSASERVG